MLSTAWADSHQEATNSLRLALLGSALTVVLTIPCVIVATAHRALNARWFVYPLVNLTLPGSLIALGVLGFASRSLPTLLDSEAPLLFAYACRYCGVAMLVMGINWARLPTTGEVAARLHGVSWWRRLLDVELPPRLPALVAAMLVVMLLIAADLEISLILVPPGTTTLGVRLYTLIHTAPDNLVSALAVDTLLLTFAMMLVGSVIVAVLRRRTRRFA